MAKRKVTKVASKAKPKKTATKKKSSKTETTPQALNRFAKAVSRLISKEPTLTVSETTRVLNDVKNRLTQKADDVADKAVNNVLYNMPASMIADTKVE